MNKKIILLSSPLPSMGKDLVGSHLVSKYGYVRQAYSDKLKQIAKEQFFWDEQKDERGRKLLINLGTITGRAYNKNIWINHVINSIKRYDFKKVVITDTRFLNEYIHIKESLPEYDVYSIGIESDVFGNKSFAKDPSQIEYENIPKDFRILNNGTKEELYNIIDSIILSEFDKLLKL